MFAYCGNNPVNFHDPTGLCQHTFSIYFKVDCKQSDCPTSRYYIEAKALRKACDTLHALVYNIELSAGFGLGLYYETEILEMIGVQLGTYGNLAEFQIKDGKITWGQRNNTAFNMSLLGLNFGTYESIFSANDGTVEQSSNIPFHSNDSFLYSDDTITIASIAIYPIFAGFSCELGFDIIQFTADLRELY